MTDGGRRGQSAGQEGRMRTASRARPVAWPALTWSARGRTVLGEFWHPTHWAAPRTGAVGGSLSNPISSGWPARREASGRTTMMERPLLAAVVLAVLTWTIPAFGQSPPAAGASEPAPPRHFHH